MRAPRRWTAVAMAFCALASAGGAGARGLWDDPAFALYRQAVEAMDGKDYERARALAAEAITHYPDHLLAHYLIGQSAMARSRWEEAATAFAAVIKLYPASFAAHREQAVALQELGRVDDAARAYEAALKLDAGDEDTRARLAFMLLQAGRRDDAQRHLDALAARQTKLPDVWVALARGAFERGDLAGAEKAFVRALELREQGTTWFNLAVVRVHREDIPGARAAFERAEQDPAVREQARREIDKLRAAAKEKDAGKPAPAGRKPAAKQ